MRQYSFFSLSKNYNSQKTLITKAALSTSCAHNSQWATKRVKIFFPGAPTWAYQPKPPLHELSLKKSPIKNHATLFKPGQDVNQIKHN